MTRKGRAAGRRSLSLRLSVYEAVRAYCEAREVSMSSVVERLVEDGLAMAYAKESREERERAAAEDAARLQTRLPLDRWNLED